MAQSKGLQEDARVEPDGSDSPVDNHFSETQMDIEWENRRLCSDESCVGVIGPDGRCKECGRPYESDTPSPEAVFADDEEMEPEADVDESMTGTESDIEWENRKLCSDESCIGVIGPDGHCKECGKKYEKNI